MTCDRCGHVLRVGDWPYCKGDWHDHSPKQHGMLGSFREYYDEDVAPPPSDEFKPCINIPEYVEGRGYRITSLRDRQRLMKLTKADYGDPKDRR